MTDVAKLVVWDRQMGLLSLVMWGGIAIKVGPHLTALERFQTWLGELLMLCIPVLWPTLSYSSYVRWRTPVLAAMRLALVAMPFLFSTRVFDALAPGLATGRFAGLLNLYTLLNGTRVVTLINISLGWRIPFGAHLAVQTATLALLMCFAVQPYCTSQLLSSPEFQGAASMLHQVMEMLVLTFVPAAPVLRPGDEYTERVAALLFLWCVLAWLLPTLLLLPSEQRQEPGAGDGGSSGSELRRSSRRSSSRARDKQSGEGGSSCGSSSALGPHVKAREAASLWAAKAAAAVESMLRLLTGSAAETAGGGRDGARQDDAPQTACLYLLRWAATLSLIWEACCLLALLYGNPANSLM